MNWWNEAWTSGAIWFWVVVGALLVGALAWWVARSAGARRAASTPQGTIDQRYSSGEIGREDYERQSARPANVP